MANIEGIEKRIMPQVASWLQRTRSSLVRVVTQRTKKSAQEAESHEAGISGLQMCIRELDSRECMELAFGVLDRE